MRTRSFSFEHIRRLRLHLLSASQMPVFPELPAISYAPLSVVLLAHGETPGEAALRTWLNALETLKREYEIIVVGPFGVGQEECSDALASLHPNIRTLPQSAS